MGRGVAAEDDKAAGVLLLGEASPRRAIWQPACLLGRVEATSPRLGRGSTTPGRCRWCRGRGGGLTGDAEEVFTGASNQRRLPVLHKRSYNLTVLPTSMDRPYSMRGMPDLMHIQIQFCHFEKDTSCVSATTTAIIITLPIYGQSALFRPDKLATK